MKRSRKLWSRRGPVLLLSGGLLAGLLLPSAASAWITPDVLATVRYEQKMGTKVQLDLPFVDETGRNVHLSDYLGDHPVFLAMVRYRCSMLCPEVLNGFVRAVEELPLQAGRDYDWVVVSLDTSETPALAAHKKQIYLARDARDSGVVGWHFLVGNETAVHALAEAVGCHYVEDRPTGAWAEPAGLVVLTAHGIVSGYLLGPYYGSEDLSARLELARAGRLADPDTRQQERCYPYDPSENPRSAMVLRIIRLGGAVTLALLLLLMGGLLRKERRELGRRAGEVRP